MRSPVAPFGALLLLLSLPLHAGQRTHAQTVRLPRLRPLGLLRPPISVRLARPLRPLAAAPAQADPAAQELLKRMLQAENFLALDGSQVTTVSRSGLDLSSEQHVQRDGARSLRIEYVRPARLQGELIVDNGRFYAHYLPAQDTLELSPSRIQSLRVRVPEVIRQIRSGQLLVRSVGQDTVAGHACGIVEAAARSSGSVPRRRFWIDPTNGAQLRIEQYDAAGQLQSASYYTQIVYSPRFDAKTFRLPVTGSKVITRGFGTPALTLDQVRAQAGFAVPAATFLPDGFRYQAGSVSEARGRRVVELRYSNGANALSVFETPDGPNSDSSKTQYPRRGVLFGRQAGMKVVIIGNLGNADLARVLAGLR